MAALADAYLPAETSVQAGDLVLPLRGSGWGGKSEHPYCALRGMKQIAANGRPGPCPARKFQITTSKLQTNPKF